MAKIFNYYSNNVDRTWYNSSNIIYTECLDNEDELKTLRVVFSNGTQYEYKDVNVNDYLLLREDASQGKALNRIIKNSKYPYEKLMNVDLNELNDELMLRSGGGYLIYNERDKFVITNTKDKEVFRLDHMLDTATFEMVLGILKSVGTIFKVMFDESGKTNVQEKQ